MSVKNLDALSGNTNLYRIIRLDYLEQMFEDHKNVLVRPRLWSDKSDGNILKVGYHKQDGLMSGLDELAYAQCWTLEKSSALMWQSYARSKFDYVRIQTTIRALVESLRYQRDPYYDEDRYYIGKVKYIDRNKAAIHRKDIFNKYEGIDILARSFLVKSHFFSGENEVRLISLVFDADYTSIEKNNIRFYPCDPNKLISKIRLSPELSQDEFKRMERVVRKLTGFEKEIARSSIFDEWDLPPISVERNIQFF